MDSLAQFLRRASARLAALPSRALYLLFFAAVALTHLTLLRLPYYWDEGGYYIPAALDFYHRFTLIPTYTNGHPPLPNVVLGTLWHITGYHILATRLTVCAFAAAALLAVFRLTQRLLTPAAAVAATFLTGCYPIWFAQSTLAHADIFAAAFTLWAFVVYFTAIQTSTLSTLRPEQDPLSVHTAAKFNPNLRRQQIAVAILFSLAALSKETAIVEPATLAALHLALLLYHRRNAALRRLHALWLLALSLPALPLAAWYAYHHHRAGFTFGNPEFLRYNATANFTAAHILQALHYRFLHLFWQRNIWVAIVLALACFFLVRRPNSEAGPLPRTALTTIAILVAANWFAFSVLGGALLTRYLLPVYPLLLLVCVGFWRTRTRAWPWLAAATATAFILAIWLNPPTSFAPEDNLTYRDMIVVHQEAVAYIDRHFPDATVLTAWPASTELFKPYLGYTTRSIKVFAIKDFSLATIQKAAQEPGDFDTALAFTQHYTSPALARYLLHHPHTRRGSDYGVNRDLSPAEIAVVLGGRIVWQDDRNGEWAAVIRFNRSYEAAAPARQPAHAQPRATDKSWNTLALVSLVAAQRSAANHDR